MPSPELKESTARQIVQRAMSILKHSVNVMNNRGVIVASGDASRLHQLHEGALLALAENRVVEINEASALLLKGVRPGINVPILFRQELVGVIGISGPPDEVRAYAELVGMAAELVIEQAEMLEQSQWEKRYREDLVQLLIQPASDPVMVSSIATYLGLDMTLPRIAVIISLDERAHDQSPALINRLTSLGKESLVAMNELHRFVLLQPLKLSHNTEVNKAIDRVMRRIKQNISDEFAVRIAVGGYFTSEDGLYRSYLSAKAMFETATLIQSRKSITSYQEHWFPVLFNHFSQSWQAEELSRSWLILKAADRKSVLCSTLRSYFDQNCDVTHTAEHLKIHVNTLRYRLQKIGQITNLNINELNSIVQLFIGMKMHP
ncbi:sugar diacid recognition domain-containing protein [Serratia sp. DD3]|uniref:sugar diacid recognition domain-containing protein n=1 Tax=Serratia sp. DD3 TaxID=1410619 RepID=UPI0003C4E4D6|nr:sugar diacid recognition domain-containing protein [Serratia sp. DD3]KEY56861.1 carbohydrate diacid regulator [Serratia sp. DD3]